VQGDRTPSTRLKNQTGQEKKKKQIERKTLKRWLGRRRAPRRKKKARDFKRRGIKDTAGGERR